MWHDKFAGVRANDERPHANAPLRTPPDGHSCALEKRDAESLLSNWDIYFAQSGARPARRRITPPPPHYCFEEFHPLFLETQFECIDSFGLFIASLKFAAASVWWSYKGGGNTGGFTLNDKTCKKRQRGIKSQKWKDFQAYLNKYKSLNNV